MEIFSYQRSFPTGCFRLKGKIRLIVTVMLGKVTAIEESRVVWFTHRTGDRERVIRETFRYVDG